MVVEQVYRYCQLPSFTALEKDITGYKYSLPQDR
jgi:hypothetical protein